MHARVLETLRLITTNHHSLQAAYYKSYLKVCSRRFQGLYITSIKIGAGKCKI